MADTNTTQNGATDAGGNIATDENPNNPVNRNAGGTAPGKAGDTPNDSVIEKPREVAPGSGSPQDTVPTRSS